MRRRAPNASAGTASIRPSSVFGDAHTAPATNSARRNQGFIVLYRRLGRRPSFRQQGWDCIPPYVKTWTTPASTRTLGQPLVDRARHLALGAAGDVDADVAALERQLAVVLGACEF